MNEKIKIQVLCWSDLVPIDILWHHYMSINKQQKNEVDIDEKILEITVDGHVTVILIQNEIMQVVMEAAP